MKKLLSVLIMTLTLSACHSASVINGDYILTDAPYDAQITLNFSDADHRYSGKVVNQYFGTYKTDKNGHLTFGDTASTMMMGPENLMMAETQYFQDLSQVIGYKISPSHLTLILKNNKELVFKKQSTN